MNVQNKKRTTVGVAIAAVGAAAIALGAGTFASFSSTQDGPDTTLAAGKLEFGARSNVDVPLSDFVPGAIQTRTMTFTNSDQSSLPGNLSLAFDLVDNVDRGCSGDEKKVDETCAAANDPSELPGKLQVTVTSDKTTQPLYVGPLSGLDGSTAVNVPNVARDSSVTYTFVFSLPNSDQKSNGVYTDNAVQGDRVKLLTTATLEQAA